MPSTRFEIVSDEIGPFLARMETQGTTIVETAAFRGARQLEAYAKQNAPWTDITGQARDGLYADVYQDLGDIVLELGHSVDYGVWLETIQDGQYAIILPTLERLGVQVVRDAGSKLMGGGDLY